MATAPSAGRVSLPLLLAVLAIALGLIAIVITFAVPGPAGPPGVAPSVDGVAWAVLQNDSTIVHGSGVTAATNPDPGVYVVTFAQAVSGCALVASPGRGGLPSGAPGPVGIGAVAVPGEPNEARFTETNVTGVADEVALQVVAVCGDGLRAVVSGTGALEAGTGVVKTVVAAQGVFDVVFDQDVSGCAYLANLQGSASGTPAPIGFVGVSTMPTTPDGVQVSTFNLSANPVNASFNLAVICTSPAWAVVATNGTLVRGAATGAELLGGGAYQVNLTSYILDCAYVVTPGSTGNSPPGVPSWDGVTIRYSDWDDLFVNSFVTGHEPNAFSFHVAAFC